MREDRVVRNEALFRELNERVLSRTERFAVVEKFEGERELVLSDPRR